MKESLETTIRRNLVNEINAYPADRKELENAYGKDNVWNTEELSKEFEVIGFLASFTVVKRKSNGVKGSVMFQANPRFYFHFVEDK